MTPPARIPDKSDAARSMSSAMSTATRFDAIQAAPFGAIGVRTEGDMVAGLVFLDQGTPTLGPADALAREACRQIAAYFNDPAHAFDLPLKPVGTAFQRRVWEAIARVPCGGSRTYGDLARELGSAARAVGQVCASNAYPLVIPCHRVVAASGLGGFAHNSGGFLPRIKRWLLLHEAGLSR